MNIADNNAKTHATMRATSCNDFNGIEIDASTVFRRKLAAVNITTELMKLDKNSQKYDAPIVALYILRVTCAPKAADTSATEDIMGYMGLKYTSLISEKSTMLFTFLERLVYLVTGICYENQSDWKGDIF